MAYKFIRAIEYVPTSTTASLASTYKLLYEAWCYCLNGGASPTTPGGLAATTPSNFPANFLEGTSVLATGTDGETVAGSSQVFSSASANFSTSVVGKHLVAWKPGSGSTDDSIYMIRARPSTTTLVIEARNGGTPDSLTGKPALTTRSGIVYRIIDLPSVTSLGSDGQYMVLQMNPSLVNPGQASSQVQFLRRASGVTAGIVVSPGGTWNGSAFTDGTVEVTGGGFGGGSQSTGYMTVIVDEASMMLHARGGFGTMAIHVEAPTRVYTLAQDPNPITWLVTSSATMFDGTNGSGNSMRMIGTDNVARTCRLIVRSLAGDGQDVAHRTVPGATMTDAGPSVNPGNGKVMSSETLLGTMATGQYTFARAKMRGIRLAGAYYPSFMRLGDLGEWIHIQNGIYWPWDNAVLPINLFAGGI